MYFATFQYWCFYTIMLLISSFTRTRKYQLKQSRKVTKHFRGFSKTYLLDSGSSAVVDHYFWFERSSVQLSAEDLLHWGGDMCPVRQTAAGKRSTRGSRVKTSSYLGAESSPLVCPVSALFVSVGPAPLSRGLTDRPHIWGALSTTRQTVRPIQRWDMTCRPLTPPFLLMSSFSVKPVSFPSQDFWNTKV